MSSLQRNISSPVHLPLTDYPLFIHCTTTNLKDCTYAWSRSNVPWTDPYAWLGCLLLSHCEFWLLMAYPAPFSQGSLLVNRSCLAQGRLGCYNNGHEAACNQWLTHYRVQKHRPGAGPQRWVTHGAIQALSYPGVRLRLDSVLLTFIPFPLLPSTPPYEVPVRLLYGVFKKSPS